MRYQPHYTISVLILLTCGLTTWTHAESFRVESEVFFGKAREPVFENLSIFSDGMIYDFLLSDSPEVTVFDPVRGRVILLDPTKKRKTTLTTEQILDFTARLKTHIRQKDNPDLFAPTFDEEFDEGSGWLTLSSRFLTYRVKTSKPKLDSAAQQYRQFADWYSRLNATRLGNPPPFARIKVNEAVAVRGLVPEEIEREITISGGLKKTKHVARSRHIINWRLSKTDRDRIAEVNKNLATFESVSYQQFCETVEVASTRK
jgi:hypothetical protein